MPFKMLLVSLVALAVLSPGALAQEAPAQAQPATNEWSWGHRLELRADYRWSREQSHPVPFPPIAPARETTVDPGHNIELNVADLQLDLGYGELFAARAKVHAQALHRRNPTSDDRQLDADELWIRFGRKPELLERPAGTTFFAQAGKFPKMERQPVRLLESYGLAATAFNRFEDTQLLVGGTVGRNFYWRVQAANGNPLFIRDPNALAGDNGTRDELAGHRELGSGFPILYNAEAEDLFFNTENVQIGEAVGWRWETADEASGIDVILFHYQRDLANTVDLNGTAYGGDLDILEVGEVPLANGTIGRLPFSGRNKEEYGARVYGEWNNLTVIAQFTSQDIANLKRDGWELEAGWRLPLNWGFVQSIQPAVRASALDNHFGPSPPFPAPSVWWDWQKYDAGVRVGLTHGLDVTLEYSYHVVNSAAKLNPEEALVTVRWRG